MTFLRLYEENNRKRWKINIPKYSLNFPCTSIIMRNEDTLHLNAKARVFRNCKLSLKSYKKCDLDTTKSTEWRIEVKKIKVYEGQTYFFSTYDSTG